MNASLKLSLELLAGSLGLPISKAKRQARAEQAIRDSVYSAIQAMNCTEPRQPEQMQPKS